MKAHKRGLVLNTKVLFPGNNSAGTLSREAVRRSVANSLKTMGVEKLGILYAHTQDEVTPLEEQAEALNEQYQKGLQEGRLGFLTFPSTCSSHS